MYLIVKYISQFQVYDRLCQYLTLHDIMLLIQTLECLYSLSSLGERACNQLTRVHGAVDTLVSLVTVEVFSLLLLFYVLTNKLNKFLYKYNFLL